MKKFCAKILVKIKPNVKDIKGITLKNAIESFMSVEDLTCSVGYYYILEFCANSEGEALNAANKIAGEILSNEVIETYEIKALEEV